MSSNKEKKCPSDLMDLLEARISWVDDEEAFDIINNERFIVNSNDKHDESPSLLHQTAIRRMIKSSQALLDKGADLEAKSYHGETPLIYAIKGGYLNMIKLFVERGANLKMKDTEGWTVMHWAAWSHDTDLIKFLFDIGIDLDAKNHREETPLIKAVFYLHHSATRYLVWLGADLSLTNWDNETALIIADKYFPFGNPMINYLKTTTNLKSIICLGFCIENNESPFQSFLVKGPIYDPRLFLLIANFK